MSSLPYVLLPLTMVLIVFALSAQIRLFLSHRQRVQEIQKLSLLLQTRKPSSKEDFRVICEIAGLVKPSPGVYL